MESHASPACDVVFDTPGARSRRVGLAADWIMAGGDAGWAGGDAPIHRERALYQDEGGPRAHGPYGVSAARVARGRHRCARNRRRRWAVDPVHRLGGRLCSDRAAYRHVTGQRDRRPKGRDIAWAARHAACSANSTADDLDRTPVVVSPSLLLTRALEKGANSLQGKLPRQIFLEVKNRVCTRRQRIGSRSILDFHRFASLRPQRITDSRAQVGRILDCNDSAKLELDRGPRTDPLD